MIQILRGNNINILKNNPGFDICLVISLQRGMASRFLCLFKRYIPIHCIFKNKNKRRNNFQGQRRSRPSIVSRLLFILKRFYFSDNLQIYDINNDGYITREEIMTLMKTCLIR